MGVHSGLITPSKSHYVDAIWYTQTENVKVDSFISTASTRWEMVITRYEGETTMTIRGPETEATDAQIPDDVEFMGISFRLGTFMPHLPPGQVLNRNDLNLPQAGKNRFWLYGSAWQYPTFENAETFIERLAREGLLVRDPLVDAVLQGQPSDLSLRSLQARFQRATGVTQKFVQQVQRAQQAAAMLRQGVSILDAVYENGYFDQPHLTRSFRRFFGQTPMQLAQASQPE